MAKTSQKSKVPLRQRSEASKTQNLTVLPRGKLNNFLNNFSERVMNFKRSKNLYIFLIILGLLILGFYKKNWIIAATVNGSPISNLELQMRLNQNFRSAILEQLITEKIILDEAAKNNVSVTSEEIDKKISEAESEAGGAQALDASLQQQGQTRENIRPIIKLRLILEKLYSKEATISAEEINKFIEQNKQSLPSYAGKDQLSASESAKLEKEVSDFIRNQKLNQIYPQKFQELRSKAKIQIF